MESDIKYIDELTKNSFNTYEQEAITNWDEFNNKFHGNINPNTNFISNLGIKKISIAVLSLSVVATGILFYGDNSNNTLNKEIRIGLVKDINLKNVVKEENSKGLKKDDKLKTKQKNTDDTKKDIVVKIKIPIHKKIEVRKKVIINNDSIN